MGATQRARHMDRSGDTDAPDDSDLKDTGLRAGGDRCSDTAAPKEHDEKRSEKLANEQAPHAQGLGGLLRR